MKYVFYLHSHITYYVTKLVIAKLGLDETKDVKYIVARHYKHSQIKNALDLEYYNQYYRYHVSKKDSENTILKIDASVNELVNFEDFEIFIPSLTHPLKQILITHAKCKKINLIEEGLSNYFNKPDFYKSPSYAMPWHKKLAFSVYRRIKRIRVRPLAVYDLTKVSSNGIFYGLFNGVAPLLPEKNKYIFGHLYQDPSFQDKYKLENIRLILLDAIAVEQNKLVTEEEYLNIFTKAITNLYADNYTGKTGIKFHPEQRTSLKESVLRFLLQQNIDFFEIPSEISVEQMLIYGKNLKVIGFFSSLLFYSKKLGHSTISLAFQSENLRLIEFAETNFPKSFKD